jgi:transposase
MRNPNPISEQRQQELEAFRKTKWPGEEFRRFLCVWLRIERKLSPAEIARVLGWHPITVRTTQQEFIRHGVEALRERPRGGRHRALMSFEEETAFLAQFGEKAGAGSILVIAEVRLALEQKLGKKVAESTVYRILHRHGWRKLVPRPFHPKRKPEAAEAFKKGASQTSSAKPESTPRSTGSR